MSSSSSSWFSVNNTMAVYIVLGGLSLALTLPLLHVILFNKDRRARKEFMVIVFASLVDMSYIFVNIFNSFWRLSTNTSGVLRSECISHPSIFLSVIVAALIAITPLAVAIDRLIVSVFGVWYYRQTASYAVCLCAVPIVLSFILGIVNYQMIMTSDTARDLISGHCYMSGAVDPNFENFYYFFKWFCIVGSAFVWVLIVYWYNNHLTSRLIMCPLDHRSKIKEGYTVLGWTMMSSIFLYLLPDMALRYWPNKTLGAMTFLFSVIMVKLLLNVVFIVIHHKELRQAYFAGLRCFKKNSVGVTSMGSVATNIPASTPSEHQQETQV